MLLDQFRALVLGAFGDQATEHDWEHRLGGVHAWVLDEDDAVVAHGAVVPRTLWVGGDAHRCGYVEGVVVATAHRRRGLASGVMAALEDVIRRDHAFGALSPTDAGLSLYRRRGWLPWLGPTSVLVDGRRIPTPEDDDGVLVLAPPSLDRSLPIACAWRPGEVW